jgi:cation diffusion facilitator CzcD-associated flavoprotein CzcO
MAKLDRKICIIGGGASGLAVLKALRDTEHFQSGKWQITVLERRSGVGGIWLVYRSPIIRYSRICIQKCPNQKTYK